MSAVQKKTRPDTWPSDASPALSPPLSSPPPSSHPSLPPFITSSHFPSPSKIPGGLDGRKDAFSRIRKKNGLRTDRRADGRTDGRTDRPSYRDSRTHLKMAVTTNLSLHSTTQNYTTLQNTTLHSPVQDIKSRFLRFRLHLPPSFHEFFMPKGGRMKGTSRSHTYIPLIDDLWSEWFPWQRSS